MHNFYYYFISCIIFATFFPIKNRLMMLYNLLPIRLFTILTGTTSISSVCAYCTIKSKKMQSNINTAITFRDITMNILPRFFSTEPNVKRTKGKKIITNVSKLKINALRIFRLYTNSTTHPEIKNFHLVHKMQVYQMV